MFDLKLKDFILQIVSSYGILVLV